MTLARQVIVVAFDDAGPLSPRAVRTRVLASALEQHGFAVERVPADRDDDGAANPSGGHAVARSRPIRVVRSKLIKPLFIDRFEPRATRMLSSWMPQGYGALLIAWPFSPVYRAARRLVRAGIPYVVDAGDPWALTRKNVPSRLRMWRAKRAESFLWRHASGGVVTTSRQGAALQAFFPDLPFLCRPNGYPEVTLDDRAATERGSDSGEELSLVHFGNMNRSRLPLDGWLSALRRETGLRRLRFVNYGMDSADFLRIEDPDVIVEIRSPVDWEEACRVAPEFDAALVVGNHDPTQLPSKAVQYLTLPIPRIAVSSTRPGDAVLEFAAAKPGYIGVDVDSRADLSRVLAHARRPWPTRELAPPASDSWDEVGREVIDFVLACWESEHGGGAERPAGTAPGPLPRAEPR